MRDAMTHRGPDEAGEYSSSEVSLGHRRLSIVDLRHGQQPTFNEDQSVVVVFNGEIYNHPQLRPTLESLGHRYHSNSDTESIVHAYETYGTDCVRHLDGMFAFVLFDRRRRLLFGARDRFGKKPLYFISRPFGCDHARVVFAFASELKALRQHPAIEAGLRVSQAALVSYLLNDYVSGTQSIFDGIERLGAGCAFEYGLPGSEHEGFRQWRYWDVSLGSHSELKEVKGPTVDEASAEVLRLLSGAVERRLMSDVPLGALLSGGIDSSSIVAMLTRLRPPREIKTFSIGFKESSFDESAYAAQVANYYGTDHYVRFFTADEMLGRLPQVTRMLDEPFADPSVLPVSLLCEFARERVTVALGGDGGDELFAGYDPFHAIGPARTYSRVVPRFVHQRVLVPMSRWMPASDANVALGFKVNRFLRGATLDPALRLATWMGAFSLEQLARLLPDAGELLDPELAYGEVQATHRTLAGQGADSLQQGLCFFQKFYLTDDILVKVDRASMMHSLEVRTPFLDTTLAEYVNALPNHLKLRGRTAKYLLKRALTKDKTWGNVVPPEIVHRRKKGFGIPVARWIRGELRDSFRTALLEEWPDQLSMFDRGEIERLYYPHVEGAQNNYKELWALFMLAEWARNHLNN
jgi:asparagine synthase (glutamine-hydrolysing)